MLTTFPVRARNIFVRYFCEGRGPFRWVALSGEASDIHVTDDLVLELFPENRICGAGLIWRASASSSGTAGAHLLAWLRESARSLAWHE